MTQAQIAEKCGVGQGTVSHWERGEWKPSVTRLPKVAEVYGVSVDMLLSEDDAETNRGVVLDAKTETAGN